VFQTTKVIYPAPKSTHRQLSNTHSLPSAYI